MIRIFSAVLLVILFTSVSFAQITYEKGYFVDNEGKKRDCLIRNVEWLNNPVKFEFKFSENTEKQTAVMDSVAEFGVEGAFKYLRRSVKMDTSSTNLKYVSENANPEFKEKVVFLKVLEEGKASLYMYRFGVETRYFYSFEDSREATQLVFKQYKNRQGALMTNDAYKQQLLFLSGCEDIRSSAIERVYFGEKELMKLFRKYNHCGREVSKEGKGKGWGVHLGLRAGAGLRGLELASPSHASMSKTLSNRKYVPRYGLESEVVLPFNKQKWALTLEISYLQMNFAASLAKNDMVFGLEEPYYLEGASGYINYVGGARHFFYLNNYSKLFIGAYVGTATSLNSEIDFKRANGQTDYTVPVTAGSGFGLGAGYKFKDRISLEVRHMGPTGTFFGLYYNYANHYETNLTLGYNLF